MEIVCELTSLLHGGAYKMRSFNLHKRISSLLRSPEHSPRKKPRYAVKAIHILNFAPFLNGATEGDTIQRNEFHRKGIFK